MEAASGDLAFSYGVSWIVPSTAAEDVSVVAAYVFVCVPGVEGFHVVESFATGSSCLGFVFYDVHFFDGCVFVEGCVAVSGHDFVG